jgi:hypothetical protein
MNLIAYAVLLTIGGTLWWRSGVRLRDKYCLLALSVLLIVWWLIWGQWAVADGWWIYGASNVSLGYVGAIPAADMLYFVAGLGWYVYFCRRLELF